MPFGISAPSRGLAVTLSLVPVVVPVAYLLALKSIVSRRISSTSIESQSPSKKGKASVSRIQAVSPASLPSEVLEHDAPYVLVCERVESYPVPARSLTVAAVADAASDEQATSALLTAYMRASMEAFSWTPQSFAIRSMISDQAIRHTFDTDYLRAADFAKGDLFNGVYQVTHRGASRSPEDDDDDDAFIERIELSVVAVPERPELAVHAIIVSEVRRTASESVFSNETWMWRRVPDEKPSLLEGAANRWLHSLLGGWLVTKGIWGVTATKKKKKLL